MSGAARCCLTWRRIPRLRAVGVRFRTLRKTISASRFVQNMCKEYLEQLAQSELNGVEAMIAV